MNQNRITFDFETRSRCELKRAGAFRYSLDASTQPTCLAYKPYDGEVVLFNFDQINRRWMEFPWAFQQDWRNWIRSGVQFSAHNAFFERCIYQNILVKRYGWPEIPLRQYRCTAAKAAACSLPRSLENVGMALKLPIQKDKEGVIAMMATCRPDKKTGEFRTPKTHPELFQTLYRYCKIDTIAEELVDKALPDLAPEEQEIWFLNQEMNWRGLRIDISTVRRVNEIMTEESRHRLKKLDALTMGIVTKPGARQAILDFLALEDVELPNLRAQTVDEALKGELPADMRELLEIRKALSKTSTRKYETMLNRANKDNRVRDILMYHGAHTGRDTGTGVQPHNFPKGLIKQKKVDEAFEIFQESLDDDETVIPWLKMIHGDSLGILFSSMLRGMIIPSEGYELFVADFAKIEVAFLWWVCGNEHGLKLLREGIDSYIDMGAAIYGKKYEEVRNPSPERDLGKGCILGCGFGMGDKKFRETVWNQQRIKLSESEARTAVHKYREIHKAVPKFWYQLEEDAVNTVQTKQTVKRKYYSFEVNSNFLWLVLPSGRRLAYREPQLTMRETDFGPKLTLEYWAVNSKTKKWGIERTWGGKLTENLVQAGARDLMMRAIVNLEKAGYRALLTVHDEALCEAPKGKGDLAEFERIMCKIPPWGTGLPIESKAWKGTRYRK